MVATTHYSPTENTFRGMVYIATYHNIEYMHIWRLMDMQHAKFKY